MASVRVLYIHVNPPASTMAARQRVLAALQEFGDVEHFRSMKHHPIMPNAAGFHAILPPSATEALLAASPLTLPLSPNPLSSPSPSPPPEQRLLTLQIHPSPHLPLFGIRSSALYRSYTPPVPSAEPITNDLHTRVPAGIACQALCDWSSDSPREKRAWGTKFGDWWGIPWRIRRKHMGLVEGGEGTGWAKRKGMVEGGGGEEGWEGLGELDEMKWEDIIARMEKGG